ncbi:uncharacterized protein [Asterias amurensis]|uniref:uncharacterized protein n=1 Tax=Asterias amurensis TaxID=7602 RepID=UPI003AB49DA7
MRDAGGHEGGSPDGVRNHQDGNTGFCNFLCAAKPLINRFSCSLICFAAGLGLIIYGIVSYTSLAHVHPGLAWQRFMYIGIGALTIGTGALALGRVCCLYRTYRRHEQTTPNVVLHGNLGPQQPQVWIAGGQTTPNHPYGPGQQHPQPGPPVGSQYHTGAYPPQQRHPQAGGAVPTPNLPYGPAGQQQPQHPPPATVGPQYPSGAYPRQQPYPQAGLGVVPLNQQNTTVQTGVSYGYSSHPGYPPNAHHAQEPTTTPSSPPPSYDDAVKNEQNKI